MKFLSVISLGLSTLLLASCAAAGPSAGTSQPETPVDKSPTGSQSTNAGAGNYILYEVFQASEDDYAETNVVLFFNAVWCSTCKKARDSFESSLNDIPQDLTIVVVDFDNSDELRKKYGVTVQHTFIQINSAGEAMGRWSGSVTIDEILSQLT